MRSTFSSDTLRLECLPALDNKLPVSLSCLSHFIIETTTNRNQSITSTSRVRLFTLDCKCIQLMHFGIRDTEICMLANEKKARELFANSSLITEMYLGQQLFLLNLIEILNYLKTPICFLSRFIEVRSYLTTPENNHSAVISEKSLEPHLKFLFYCTVYIKYTDFHSPFC
ncbi:hypothetical protein ANN_06265 [Periplaneta americana]|uniref:Uncharacterized protein n=1 Tax=Periplaneta americana TaxID=6978 RepID=A0ABQ8TDY8_PERAM|nr:hypothetical protein ANN_06265 [Periplaneta americana]